MAFKRVERRFSLCSEQNSFLQENSRKRQQKDEIRPSVFFFKESVFPMEIIEYPTENEQDLLRSSQGIFLFLAKNQIQNVLLFRSLDNSLCLSIVLPDTVDFYQKYLLKQFLKR